jgi:hypothetical protein
MVPSYTAPRGKKGLKVAGRGLRHWNYIKFIVSYPLKVVCSLIHLQRRHRTKRRESPLLAKEGTVKGISRSARNTPRLRGSFTCRKVGTWDRLFNFPSERKAGRGFFTQKKSNGFGRVRTRELTKRETLCSKLHVKFVFDSVLKLCVWVWDIQK